MLGVAMLSVSMLSILIMSVIMLSVAMLIVVRLNVVASNESLAFWVLFIKTFTAVTSKLGRFHYNSRSNILRARL